jgi:F-type H+-transporting ATPase subunit a
VLKPESSAYRYVEVFENAFFAILAGLFLCLVALRIHKNRSIVPGRLQAFAEMIVEWLEGLASTMMGPKYGRHFTPFIATIFVYIAAMNYFVLIPLGKSPTSTFLNNISIALVVFVYVQYTGIKRQGIGGYLYHLAGSPKDVVSWSLSPLLFALELFGEFVKPVSLSLRLFGNIFGEDMLLAVFALLGVVALSAFHSPIGLPLNLPFYFLAMLLGLIQALVFSLLSTVYIALMLPHGEHAHSH